jgi:hypothetical protein
MLEVAPVTVRRDRVFVNTRYEGMEDTILVSAIIPDATVDQIAVAPDSLTAQTSRGKRSCPART